ncbi:MAG: hypothetical protein M3Y81_02375 [Chloroflexota bacterium]|nr:hypothetical protein [Chloroflexota bacterium]
MMDESADPRLIALMLTGDQKAFATLIERYQFMAQRLAVQLTGNQDVARQLVQDVIQQDPHSIAVLVDTNGRRILPLWIGYWEGQAILSTLQNLPTAARSHLVS